VSVTNRETSGRCGGAVVSASEGDRVGDCLIGSRPSNVCSERDLEISSAHPWHGLQCREPARRTGVVGGEQDGGRLVHELVNPPVGLCVAP
jgi:hypothetical protein